MSIDFARLLITGQFEQVPAAHWAKRPEAGYVYHHTSAAYRKGLSIPYVHALERWQVQQQDLLPLLSLWTRHGIEVTLLKGLATALAHYPAPHLRFAGDVDLLLSPPDVPRARELAESLGWETLFDLRRDGGGSTYESLGLLSPSRRTKLDVHHALLKHPRRFQQRALQLSQQALKDRVALQWEGLSLLRLSDADQALFTLILHRSWYQDGWRLKPFDGLDLVQLQRAGLSREQLLHRASGLGLSGTAELFLQRCDPWLGVFDLTPPDSAQIAHWEKQVSAERGYAHRHMEVPRWKRRLSHLPALLQVLPGGLYWVGQALLALRHTRSIPELVNRFPLRPQPRPDLGWLWRARRGVLAVTVLLGPRAAQHSGICVLRSLALLWWLRSQGIDAELVSGVRQDQGQIQGHAWVEYHGQVVPTATGDRMSPQRFRENFRSGVQATP